MPATAIGRSWELTIRQLAEQIIELTGSRSRIVFRPLPVDDPRVRQPDIARARTLLGWEPRVPLDEVFGTPSRTPAQLGLA